MKRLLEVRYGLGVNGGMAAITPCLFVEEDRAFARDQV
jgi:hypothetical protein